MKDKEAWATIGQFLVDFRQIAGICWEGLDIQSCPEEEALDKWAIRRRAEQQKDVLRKILDYIEGVTKKRPKLLWSGQAEIYLDYRGNLTAARFRSCGEWAAITLFKEIVDIEDDQTVDVFMIERENKNEPIP